MADDRSCLFDYVPATIHAVGQASAGLGIRLGFVEENVNIGSVCDVTLGGTPPKFDHLLPPGFHTRMQSDTRLPTLTCCKAQTHMPCCPNRHLDRYSDDVVYRWQSDSYRYPIFAYVESNLMWSAAGEWDTWPPQVREALQGFPVDWTGCIADYDRRCALLGNTYQTGVYARVIRHLNQAPLGRSDMCSSSAVVHRSKRLRPEPGVSRSQPSEPHASLLSEVPDDPASSSTAPAFSSRRVEPAASFQSQRWRAHNFAGTFSEWPELRLQGAVSYNAAILALLPEAVQEDVRALLPQDGVLENLIAPIREWHSQRPSATVRPVGPDLEAIGARAERAAATGYQRGGYHSRVSITPPVPEGLGKTGQMDTVCTLPHPFHLAPIVEHDLQFALSQTVGWGADVCAYRRARIRIVESVGHALSQAEHPARGCMTKRVRRVCHEVNLLFIAFMVVFTMWPHTDVIKRFIYGYSAIGDIPATGIFRATEREATQSPQDLLSTSRAWHDQIFNSPPPENAQEIFEATEKEQRKGAVGGLKDRHYFDHRFGASGWRGVLRFRVFQHNKFRPIDDGKYSGHNSAQHIHEKVHNCPPEFMLIMGIKLLADLPARLPAWAAIEGGVDDLQDAYRGCPTSDDSAPFIVILVYNPKLRRWQGAEIYGHSYGFRSSVNNFNAFPELGVAFCRRALAVLTAHYVDDFPTVDYASGKGTAQQGLNSTFTCSGVPFAKDKRVLMSACCCFLGQVNDFSEVLQTGDFVVRAKEGRAETITEYVDTAMSRHALSPGTAGKLYGLVQYYGTSIQGQIAKGGLQPVKHRQLSNSSHMTAVLRQALDYIRVMVQVAPPRRVHVRASRPVAVVWSDAEYNKDHPEWGGGLGYIIQYPHHVVGGAARATPDDISAFLPKAQQIGQLEAIVPLVAIFNEPDLKGYDLWWGVDNTSAEAALIRGYSTKADTASIVASTHIVIASHDIRVFYFHVDSDSNPSDGLSRLGLEDPWTLEQSHLHGWTLYRAQLPDFASLSKLPLRLIVDAFG